MIAETSRVGKRGTIVIPVAIRRRLRIEEGAFVIVEEREDGVLIRPAAVMPIEMNTAERRAEFLLSNAIDAEDYARAREEVRRTGLDPDAIPHYVVAGD